jgi:glutamyl/glutaminyl-tRNA synthetase
LKVGRLAPTPSGRLHLGNALAFGAAWLSARQAGARLLLRIEDVDRTRARADLEASIRDDLRWLGLDWDEEVPPQRNRAYGPWIELLAARGRVYRCTCTRRDLVAHGGVYPGTCREAGHAEGAARLRLPLGPVRWVDRRFGPREVDPNAFGDPVLQRRDGTASYNLAVVVDDLCDGVTEVVRGADLVDFTAVQIRLWEALGATPPTWLHAPLLLGPDGTKLSKRHGSTEIAAMAAAGATARDVWRRLLPVLGIEGIDHVHGAVDAFVPDRGPLGPVIVNLEEPIP